MIREWKQDSTGCAKLRSKYADELEQNKLMIGMPIKE